MTTLRLCIIVALLALTGCDTVLIDAPIGEKLCRDEAVKLVGKWSDDEQNSFELQLSKKGEVVFGALVWNDENQRFEATTKALDVRTVDGAIYVFAIDDKASSEDQADEPDDPQFIFFRVDIISESEIQLFLADIKAIRKAIEAGNLDGIAKKRSKSTDVFIKASEEKSKRFIASKQWGTLFQSEPSFKLKLIKKAD